MLDGDHDIDMCQKISEKVLVATFAALHKAGFELFRNKRALIVRNECDKISETLQSTMYYWKVFC